MFYIGPAALKKTYYLLPGALFVSGESYLVTTVLGSCVAVCLWDPVMRVGGINHFLLPLWNGNGLASSRFGNVAISKLIEKMISEGCQRRNIIAKVFGGSAMWEDPGGVFSVGERNAIFAFQYLEEESIPIVASDIGGNLGRKVIFDTEIGEVAVQKNIAIRNEVT